jgi:hypothetical protein
MEIIGFSKSLHLSVKHTLDQELNNKFISDFSVWREEAENPKEADQIIALVIECYERNATDLCLWNFYSIVVVSLPRETVGLITERFCRNRLTIKPYFGKEF